MFTQKGCSPKGGGTISGMPRLLPALVVLPSRGRQWVRYPGCQTYLAFHVVDDACKRDMTNGTSTRTETCCLCVLSPTPRSATALVCSWVDQRGSVQVQGCDVKRTISKLEHGTDSRLSCGDYIHLPTTKNQAQRFEEEWSRSTSRAPVTMAAEAHMMLVDRHPGTGDSWP